MRCTTYCDDDGDADKLWSDLPRKQHCIAATLILFVMLDLLLVPLLVMVFVLLGVCLGTAAADTVRATQSYLSGSGTVLGGWQMPHFSSNAADSASVDFHRTLGFLHLLVHRTLTHRYPRWELDFSRMYSCFCLVMDRVLKPYIIRHVFAKV